MTVKLRSPHPFSERFLLFGGGGVGKTNTALTIIDHVAVGDMHVVEQDYSLAYERALATDFTDVADRVHVYESDPEWPSFIGNVEKAVAAGDPDIDWLVIDPISSSWDWVQEWALDEQYGKDMPEVLLELRKQYGLDKRAYAAAMADIMNWNLVKKEYARLWKAVQRWKGHLVLIAEAKAVPKSEDDAEIKMLYGPLGFQPVGQASLRHVASTTLFLDHPKRGQWRVTTIKDRNRSELDREPIDNFAIDYLQSVAGWEIVRPAKKKAADAEAGDAR